MTQYFLGWDKPIVELAVEFLLRDVSGRPLDLSRVMVVVPTRQAGRRLRECLADAARECGTMVLSPAVVQPSHFLRPRGAVASRAECLAVLADVLLELDYAQYANLFPASAGANQSGDFRWRLETAELFLELRRELCEGGHTVATASAGLQANPDFLEAARWDELAALEAAFLAGLRGAGLADPAQAQIEVANEPVLPEGIQRLVIIGVPDPVPLAVRAWERLDQEKTVPVDVCIHAPPEQSGCFDAWGRPARAHWTTCSLPLQDECIHLVPKPPDQADTARQLLPAPFLGSPAGNGGQQANGSAAVGRLALGVLDEEVMPHLEATLRAAGIPVSNPAMKPVASHALYHLVRDLLGLAQTDGYEDFSSLLRNPHLLRYLEQYEGGVTAEYLLREADRLQNEHIPASFSAVRLYAQQLNTAGSSYRYGSGLVGVCSLLRGWLERLRQVEWPKDLRDILTTIYTEGAPAPGNDSESGLQPVAEALQDVLEAMASAVVEQRLPPDASARQELLLHLVAGQTYAVEDPGARVDLEGWLELHWNEAPLLILAGFNEGRVPAAIVGHAFLPDSARRVLALPDNDSRLARDSYLLAALLAFRPRPGAVQIVLGKTTAGGDALKPSRLLFRCGDDSTLAARSLRLFGRPSAAPSVLSTIPPEWRLRVPRRDPPLQISVTALKDYLQCPFRFYLKNVLRMAEADDLKRELDALDFGVLCHGALGQFAENAALRDSTDADAIGDYLIGEARAAVTERSGQELSAALTLQIGSMEQRLRYAARVQAELRAQGWRIAELNGRYAEHTMTLEIDEFTIVARIDRIDVSEDTGRYRILDYKTSDTAEPPFAAHLGTARDDMPPWRTVTIGKKLKAWSDLQLPLYLLMAQRQPGWQSAACGYFSLPKAVTETAVAEFTELDVALLQSGLNCATGVLAAIRARTFWPPAVLPANWTDDFDRLCRGNWQDAVEFIA